MQYKLNVFWSYKNIAMWNPRRFITFHGKMPCPVTKWLNIESNVDPGFAITRNISDLLSLTYKPNWDILFVINSSSICFPSKSSATDRIVSERKAFNLTSQIVFSCMRGWMNFRKCSRLLFRSITENSWGQIISFLIRSKVMWNSQRIYHWKEIPS